MASRILAARQAGMTLQSARALIANPTPTHSPFLRRLAWDVLKGERARCGAGHKAPTDASLEEHQQ